MAKRGLTLSVKIFLGTSLVVLIVLGATLGITAFSATRTATESVSRVVGTAREALLSQLEGRAEVLRRSSEVFASNPELRFIVRDRDFATSLDQATVATDLTNADWAQIVDAQGLRLAKSDDPAAPEESLAGSPAIGGALEGESVTAFGINDDTLLIQLAVVPIRDLRVYGALMVASYLQDEVAGEVKRAAVDQIEVVFYALDGEDTPHANGSTLPKEQLDLATLEELHALASNEDENARADLTLGDRRYVAAGGLLRSAGGYPLGGFAILRDRDAELVAFRAFERTVLFTGIGGLLFAFLFSVFVARWVTRPVARLADAARRASDGDYGADITASSRDEIGALAGAFQRLLSDLREKQQLVDFLSSAEGGATVQLATQQTQPGTGTQPTRGTGSVLLRPGMVFANRYEVKEVLGQGGMGTVVRALDRELGEQIAIKTLKQEFLDADPAALERFKSEIRLARRISHRNVVRTHDLGEHEGQYFITMEYVEGTSLKQLIRARGRLPLNVVLSVGKQLARALEVAHEQGIIHRDVKPQNIVVEPSGVLKVMDFGIARLAQRPQASGVTQAGAIVGTPEYMAPEQATGEAVDHRADIFAAGAVLYECLIGRPPIVAESLYQLIAALLEDSPRPPREIRPEVPEALNTLVLDCLAKEPAKRPQTAVALHDRLDAIG